jgi:predicted RNA-binding Zn ribbon-like protein
MTSLPLKYIGGDPALDLVNTADWTADGPRAERLPDYARLLEWAQGAGIVAGPAVVKLRREARRRPAAARDALAAAHDARAILQRTLSRRARGAPFYLRELAAFNALLGDVVARLELTPSASSTVLGFRELGERLESPLWPVVWSAARLLTSDEADRIRVCGGPDCGWMYVDRSRNGLRRWCEMETCGTRAKNRRRASAR